MNIRLAAVALADFRGGYTPLQLAHFERMTPAQAEAWRSAHNGISPPRWRRNRKTGRLERYLPEHPHFPKVPTGGHEPEHVDNLLAQLAKARLEHHGPKLKRSHEVLSSEQMAGHTGRSPRL